MWSDTPSDLTSALHLRGLISETLSRQEHIPVKTVNVAFPMCWIY